MKTITFQLEDAACARIAALENIATYPGLPEEKIAKALATQCAIKLMILDSQIAVAAARATVKTQYENNPVSPQQGALPRPPTPK